MADGFYGCSSSSFILGPYSPYFRRNQTDQMGSMHYYSNGVILIGVLRKKAGLFTYRLIITVENSNL